MKGPLRKVTKSAPIGGSRYTGYVAKSIEMSLDCGHKAYRKASDGIPRRARCRECARAAFNGGVRK